MHSCTHLLYSVGRNCCQSLKVGEKNKQPYYLDMHTLDNPFASGVEPKPESHRSQKARRGRIFISARKEAARNPSVKCPGERQSFSMCSEDYNSKTEANAVLSQIAIDWLIHWKDKDWILRKARQLKTVIYKEKKILFFPELESSTQGRGHIFGYCWNRVLPK